MNASSDKRRPKVCLISATPLTIHFFFKEFVTELSEWADVTLVFNASENTEIQPIELPCDVESLPLKRQISPVFDLICLIRLFNLFRTKRFDMVITLVPKAGLLGSLAALAANVGVRLHIFQGEVWSSKSGLLRFILKCCDKITVMASNALLAVSISEREFLISEKVVRAENILVLGQGSISGVNTSVFRPDTDARMKWRRHHGIKENECLILFLGRINRDKGVLELFLACRQLLREFADVKLAIVGPDEDSLTNRMIAQLDTQIKSRVICPGLSKVPHEWLNASDILALPSYREGFGVVALEASACERPVIATKIHGLTDAVIDAKTGILVPHRDSEALYNALKLLSQNPDLRVRLGKEGRVRVKDDFEQKVVVKRYIDFIAKLLER